MTLDLLNLLKDLPQSKTLAHEVKAELATEFKNAAKLVAALYSAADNKDDLKDDFTAAARSVASLYRTTYQLNEVFQQQGFLDCVDELLKLISAGGDVENWALTRRAEVIKDSGKQKPSSTASSDDDSAAPVTVDSAASDASLPAADVGANLTRIELPDIPLEFAPFDYEFAFTGPGPRPPTNFRPLMMPPLSVTRSIKQRQHYRRNRKLRMGGGSPNEILESSDDGSGEEDGAIKRKIGNHGLPDEKRRRHGDGDAQL